MKLYATVTSERATKGQGGNWLEIEILGENKKLLGIIKVFPQDKNNPYGLISYNWLVGTSEGYQVRSEGIMEAKDTEVEDKRGELCEDCGATMVNGHCPECWGDVKPIKEEVKGKRRKGEDLFIEPNTGASLKHCPKCGTSKII